MWSQRGKKEMAYLATLNAKRGGEEREARSLRERVLNFAYDRVYIRGVMNN